MRDVIIIGAGPAGSSLAYYLAKEGIDVLLIDKECFPRYKPCAGAFSVSLESYFDFSLHEIIETTYTKMTFKKDKNEFILKTEAPITHLVNREHFDYLLINKAIESGCSFVDGMKVTDIKENKVFTDSGKFYGRIIIGADGGGSIVRRCGKYRRIKSWIKTISADIPSKKYNEIIFDFSWVKNGYAWIFPKRDVLSVGVGANPVNLLNPDTVFKKFLKNYGLPPPVVIYRYTYPLFSSPELLTWKNTLLIGDAAALSNPISGGGIYNAIESAYLASNVIKLNINKGIPLLNYQKLINKYIYPLLIVSKFFYYIFAISPMRILKLGKCGFIKAADFFSTDRPPF